MDEILVEAPGKCTLNIEKSFTDVIKDGLDPLDPSLDLTKYKIDLHFDADEEALFYTNLIVEKMQEAQQMFFLDVLPAKAAGSVAPFWKH